MKRDPELDLGVFFVLALWVFVAMMLMVIRLPESIDAWRPDWVGLVVICWAVLLPRYCGPGFGFLVGIAVDVIMTETLGVYALVYTLLAYMANVTHHKMRMFPMWQQALVVFGLTLIARMVIVLLVDVDMEIFTEWRYWTPLLVNMLVWPWIYYLLREAHPAARL